MQGKRKKKKTSPLIPILIIMLIVVGVMIFANSKKGKNKEDNTVNYNGSSIIGTYLYEKNNTKYTFKEDGTGSMSSDNYNFEYKYKIDGATLSIDFAKDEVHDVVYSYEVKAEELKLISKEGTISIGEEYILKKENK